MKQGNKQMGSEMDEGTARVYPKWFWVIAGCALIWNLMGFVIFYGETFQQEAVIAGFEPAQQEWMRSTPRWIYVVFGLSVGTGIVGSVLLLTKKKSCIALFLISFIAVLVQMAYTMLIAGGLKVMGPSGAIMPCVVIFLAGLWLGFSIKSSRHGWLGS